MKNKKKMMPIMMMMRTKERSMGAKTRENEIENECVIRLKNGS
jgi:hypothetical protein